MTHYIAYAPTRTELDAQAICEDLEIPCIVPRKVEAIRQGKRRWPDPVISAAWPNYAFLTLTDAQWHQLHQLRKPPFRGTFHLVAAKEWDRCLLPAVARVEQDFQYRMEMIEAGQRVAEYNAGDALTMIGGPFAGQMLRFKAMVEAAHEVFPQIKATMDMMGREVDVLLDPIHARKAAE